MENIKPLRILYISARSDMGGGPKQMAQLVEKYSNDADFKIFIAAPTEEPFGPVFQKVADEFVPIKHRSFSLFYFVKLLIFCKNFKVDIIHSHGRGAGYYSRLLGLFGFKVLHTFHGIHTEEGLIARLKFSTDKLLSTLTTKFISVSHSEKNKAIEAGFSNTENIEVIYNSINLEKIKNLPAIDLHQKYSIPRDKKLWGTLARLSPEKGLDIFLNESAQEFSNDEFVFLIAGDGPSLEEYRKVINKKHLNHVILTGYIEDPIGFLKGIDGYFSFSKAEGLPLSVIEALACGLKCVLSEVSGHVDFIPKVSLFPLNDTKRFKEIIQDLELTPTIHNLADFSSSKMLAKTKTLYISLMDP